MIEYKNMASLDGLDDKYRAISAKTIGTDEQQKNMYVKRIDIREIFGGKVVRELILK